MYAPPKTNFSVKKYEPSGTQTIAAVKNRSL